MIGMTPADSVERKGVFIVRYASGVRRGSMPLSVDGAYRNARREL